MIKPTGTARRASVYVDGDRLRQTRQKVQLTQEQAGAKAGYSDRLIRKLESGGPVSTETLHDVVEAYRENSPTSLSPNAASFVLPQRRSENEGLVLDWFRRAYNERDVTVIDDLLHPSVHLAAGGRTGRQSARLGLEKLWVAFDPLKVRVEQTLCDGDSVVASWIVQMVQVKEFFGLAPTPRRLTVRGSSNVRFSQGQMIEVRDHVDVCDLIRLWTVSDHSPQ